MRYWQYKTWIYTWDDEKQDLGWVDTKEVPVDADMVDKRLNELGREG